MQKLTTTTLFCLICVSLTACSGSVSVGYQPPVLPIKISINTNGELQVSWENSIQTPYGTFSAEVSSDLSELYLDRNGVLIVNVNGVNSVYDLNGQNNIAITLESGYYRQIELRKGGNNWYFEAQRVSSELPTAQQESESNSGSNDSYGSHTYKVYQQSLSWSGAEAQCENQGGYLAVITSSGENEFIWKLATQNSFPNYSVAWIGATDNSSEDNWEWVTGESFNSLGNLVVGGGTYENYLNLRLATGEWEDFPLNGEQVGEQWYICEWE
jgi:hypothetical protein